MHWTANLDHSRAAGVNPTAVSHWFELVASTFQAHNFASENVYGFDESGFPFGGDGARQRVIGRTDTSLQHVQRGGNRENVTVMVTICADGTTTRPVVIFKGKKMYSDWTRANVASMRQVKSTHRSQMVQLIPTHVLYSLLVLPSQRMAGPMLQWLSGGLKILTSKHVRRLPDAHVFSSLMAITPIILLTSFAMQEMRTLLPSVTPATQPTSFKDSMSSHSRF
jgi:hypothetical protein